MNGLFDFYEKEYKLVTTSYEFDEDECYDAGILYIDTNTIIASLADIIAFARERCCDTAGGSAILWNDNFVLHYIFGDYTIKEMNY